MTATAADEAIIAGLDFDHALVCEWPVGSEPCERRAEWLARNPCGCTWTLCTTHVVHSKREDREALDYLDAHPECPYIACMRCNANNGRSVSTYTRIG